MSQYDDKPIESVRNKRKHLARRAAGQSQVKSLPTISCVCCHVNFTSEDEKRNHLMISSSCQLYLKNSFLDGQFFNDTPVCDNYTLNKYMCPFCLFTVDNGLVIDHILTVIKCRNKLEEAISKFHMQSRKLPASQYEPQLRIRFKCNICKRKYKTIKHLKRHKTLKHSDSDYSNSSQQTKVRRHDHLFCFFCEKFLKSEPDINRHRCRPTRLLSRYWYRKAVWTEGEYHCTVCFDKFFHYVNDLEKHMYIHDKKTSHLFNFLPDVSNQTEQLHVSDLDITNGNSSDTSCHNDNCIIIESDSDVSSAKLSINVSQNEKSRTGCFSASNDNKTFIAETSVYKCIPCQWIFHDSGQFVEHILQVHENKTTSTT